MTTASDSWGPCGLVVAAPDSSGAAGSGHAAALPHGFVDLLLMMVPLCIAEMQAWSDERLEAARHASVQLITSHGDDLQFGGRHRGAALAATARGLALGARAPGGITALGIHACTRPHEGCPGLGQTGHGQAS